MMVIVIIGPYYLCFQRYHYIKYRLYKGLLDYFINYSQVTKQSQLYEYGTYCGIVVKIIDMEIPVKL